MNPKRIIQCLGHILIIVPWNFQNLPENFRIVSKQLMRTRIGSVMNFTPLIWLNQFLCTQKGGPSPLTIIGGCVAVCPSRATSTSVLHTTPMGAHHSNGCPPLQWMPTTPMGAHHSIGCPPLQWVPLKLIVGLSRPLPGHNLWYMVSGVIDTRHLCQPLVHYMDLCTLMGGSQVSRPCSKV